MVATSSPLRTSGYAASIRTSDLVSGAGMLSFAQCDAAGPVAVEPADRNTCERREAFYSSDNAACAFTRSGEGKSMLCETSTSQPLPRLVAIQFNRPSRLDRKSVV